MLATFGRYTQQANMRIGAAGSAAGAAQRGATPATGHGGSDGGIKGRRAGSAGSEGGVQQLAATGSGDVSVSARWRRRATRLCGTVWMLLCAVATVARNELWRAVAWVEAVRAAAALAPALFPDRSGGGGGGGAGDQGQYETRLLESAVYKICALLAVGFGDAGAEVIAENIREGGDLNPMVPGKRTVRRAGAIGQG
jgi:hypothetical protein